MIEIANIENSSIVEISASGKLTKEDIQQVDDFFDNKVSDLEKVNVLLLLENWEGLTFKALIEDFKMIKHWKSFNKTAFVADSKYLKEDSKLESLFPSTKIEYFNLDQKEMAKMWLEE
ncbi:STAS/SEC14 domain-containing protein [Gracilibacillus salinarum]|uniref:STAS/SEC14 domain-containing protein n=1 Tax=Gracilibacillus salinarum TaxID=2932255 RepID=A0ABY4GS74_9BACI|nr:STAS/SEC14 domain-containing protein [Gracilibacillus salinarum]UOQ87237.1 STAS/SEC14 domain-containing protein [Gracilibacillus salinarum]